MSYDIFQIGLTFPQLAPGVSCLSSVSGCALVVVSRGLAIRMYWPFSGECGVLKRQRERLERERGPGCVFEYLCSLS